jgi:heptosyltransferase-2
MNSEKPRKILLIRFSSMGDVILITPLLSTLKDRYPDSQITLLTDSSYVELFSDDPRLAKVHGVSKTNIDSIVQLLQEPWDLVVDLQRNRRSKYIVGKLTSCKLIGLFNKLHFKRMLLLLMRVNLYSKKDNVVARYIRAAAEKTDALIPPLKMHFDAPLSKVVLEMRLTGEIVRPAIALFPFCAWNNKAWPLENYIQVGKYFLVKGWDVFIFGGPAERDTAEVICEAIGPRCVSFAGKISLYECGCVLKRCSLALGNDTGLTHLARACGLKVGVIYGPTTHHFGFYPYGDPPFKVFESAMICRPCHAHGGNFCILDKMCLRNIDPDKVIDGLLRLVTGNSV